jgi:hypothetical protein
MTIEIRTGDQPSTISRHTALDGGPVPLRNAREFKLSWVQAVHSFDLEGDHDR